MGGKEKLCRYGGGSACGVRNGYQGMLVGYKGEAVGASRIGEGRVIVSVTGINSGRQFLRFAKGRSRANGGGLKEGRGGVLRKRGDKVGVG